MDDLTNTPAVFCKDVSKHFEERDEDGVPSGLKGLFRRGAKRRVTAVDRVSFSIQRGEIYGVLGPNGSGKSTLVRMLSTLIIPDEGEIRIFGQDVMADSLAVRRNINRVSVDAAFFKKLSVWENLSVVQGTLRELRDRVGKEEASMEEIFIELTGKELVELDEE